MSPDVPCFADRIKTMHRYGVSLLFLITICSCLYFAPPLCAQDWNLTAAPTNSWSAIACSADGNSLIAAMGRRNTALPTAHVFTSTNSGAAWIQTGLPGDTYLSWSSVASSADGHAMTAAMYGQYFGGQVSGEIYSSTNRGMNWGSGGIYDYFHGIASSADGRKLAAVAFIVADKTDTRRPIYLSTNSGASWAASSAPINNWEAVSSSANGTKLVAVAQTGDIYTSTDSGTTWVSNGIPNVHWAAVASSGDGTRLSAAAYSISNGDNPALIYRSTNSGLSWTATTAPSNYWVAIASSADGTTLVAAAESRDDYLGGPIYTSTNSGITWTSNNAPRIAWTSIASSADGCRLFAAARIDGYHDDSGLIYTYQTSPTPQLRITPSQANLVLSWLVPSTKFVLQQNSDLGSTNWTEVLAQPSLNYSNLEYQVSVQPSEAANFYRLVSRASIQ